jgi:hypothetical protein
MSRVFSTTVTHVRVDQAILFIDATTSEVRCEVRYSLIDEDGNVYKAADGIYWEVMPEQLYDVNGDPMPYPENYRQMPVTYADGLRSLMDDIKTDIESIYQI